MGFGLGFRFGLAGRAIDRGINLGGGIYVPRDSVVSHYKGGDSLPAGDTFARASAGWAWETDGAVPLIGYSTDEPRFTSGRGVWIEGARTNEIFNNVFAGAGASWTAPTGWFYGFSTGSSTPQTSVALPSGLALRQVASAQRPEITQNRTLVAATYAQSLIIEAAVDPQDTLAYSPFWVSPQSHFSAGTIQNWAAAANANTSAQQIRYGIGVAANASGDVVFSLPQLEVGAFCSTPIVNTNTAATQTRAAETWTTPFADGEISVRVRARAPLAATTRQVLFQTDTDVNNRLTVFQNASGELMLEVYRSGGEETSMLIDVLTPGQDFSLYVGMTSSSVGFSFDEGAVVADAITAPSIDTVRTGHDIAGNHWFSTFIERFIGNVVP